MSFQQKTADAYRTLLAHYLNLMIPQHASLLEVGAGQGDLLSRLHAEKRLGIERDPTLVAAAEEKLEKGSLSLKHADGYDFVPEEAPDYLLLADTLNEVEDIQALLAHLRSYSKASTRLVISCYNTLWRPLLQLASLLGLRAPEGEELNWLSQDDLKNLLELAGWELVCQEERILAPLPIPFLSSFLNRWVAPFLPWFALTHILVARPRPTEQIVPKSVSIVVPARNEAGNIVAAIERTPVFGSWQEFIFIEGNSTDNTWEVIQELPKKYPDLRIKIAQQPGKGKGDAVRTGFAMAEGDILMILDADLTMPPEDLPKFYEAVASGASEFANGSRLVYPMEKKAMRFANLIANKAFGIGFSWLLGQNIKDTLCGTKVMKRLQYQELVANRSYFGNFDPFGDFDLLFGASKLHLKIRDIPVRYKDRTYGTTNIKRWSSGVLLLRMFLFAAVKLKFL